MQIISYWHLLNFSQRLTAENYKCHFELPAGAATGYWWPFLFSPTDIRVQEWNNKIRYDEGKQKENQSQPAPPILHFVTPLAGSVKMQAVTHCGSSVSNYIQICFQNGSFKALSWLLKTNTWMKVKAPISTSKIYNCSRDKWLNLFHIKCSF